MTDINLEQPIDPCHHMKVLLSRLSDDDLRGLSKWYTEFHAAGCPRCRSALEALQQLPEHVRSLAEQEDLAHESEGLTEERWVEIEKAWAH